MSQGPRQHVDFFEAQERARKRTRWLIALYLLALVAITFALYAVVLVAFHSDLVSSHQGARINLWHPEVFASVALITGLIVGGATAIKTMQLSSGGGSVAESLGGSEVTMGTTDADERKLLNVVEEMAIASGVPMPRVYILPERSINAFAAGYKIEDAAVAVTRGAIEQLSRDELQGVMAHEFSHILSGDMRLNIRLIGPIFGLVAISFIGRALMRSVAYSRPRSSRDSGKGAGALLLLGLAVMVIGYIGTVCGRFIQAAISRQREFLADAAAVQFTRNELGIANALRRLGRFQRGPGTHIRHAHVEDTAHMFFGPALSSMYATHPPLEERIRAIYPAWDGTFLPARKAPPPIVPPPLQPKQSQSGSRGFPGGMTGAAMVAAVGVLDAGNVRQAGAIREKIEADFKEHLATPQGAEELITALILDADHEARKVQIDLLASWEDAPYHQRVADAAKAMDPYPAEQRYALLEMALGGTRPLPSERIARMREILRALADADEHLSIREFLVMQTFSRVTAAQRSPRTTNDLTDNVREIADDASILLAALARVSRGAKTNPELARDHFAKAVASQYRLAPHLSYPEHEIELASLERPLNRLASTSFRLRRQLITAAAQIVLSDGATTREEWNLLRLIAFAMECPMPPVPPQLPDTPKE